MYRMIQPNIRGQICHASVRYASANNMYMGALFRPEMRESFIMYIDATNLDGWAISQALPYSDFEWFSDAEIREADVALTSANNDDAMRFFEMANRYAVELRRILIAYVNGVVSNPPEWTDIKMDTAYILEVDL